MAIPQHITHLPIIWQLRKIVLYSLYTLKATIGFKKPSLLITSLYYLPVWWKHNKRNNNPLNYDRPWITFAAKNFLDKILTNNSLVFEYGSGSSTLYFARRVAKIYSIENDNAWYNYLCNYLKKNNIENINYQLIEGIPSTTQPSTYTSLSSIYKNINFEDYVKTIDALPNNYFDVIVVDGRARNACIKHAISKLKQNGYLMVDNSERDAYFTGNEFLFDTTSWIQTSFIGPTPYSFGFSKTSFFQKK